MTTLSNLHFRMSDASGTPSGGISGSPQTRTHANAIRQTRHFVSLSLDDGDEGVLDEQEDLVLHEQEGGPMTPARIRHYPRAHGPLPAGARWVGRPSRWGNPHKVGVELDAAEAVARFRSYAVERLAAEPAWLDPLRDASALACACRLGDPCHADVLAELLGAEEATP